MRVVCPGWFGRAHQPVTLKGSPLDGEVSHGICPECLAAFDAARDGLSAVDTGGGADSLLHRVRAEYLEMPGLQLTPAQAQCLWGLDEVTSAAVLSALVDAGFLRRTTRDTFVRVDGAT